MAQSSNPQLKRRSARIGKTRGFLPSATADIFLSNLRYVKPFATDV
jgi:hypothetical protein